jgi:hypothetical protein
MGKHSLMLARPSNANEVPKYRWRYHYAATPIAEAYGIILHTDHCAKKLYLGLTVLLDALRNTLNRKFHSYKVRI